MAPGGTGKTFLYNTLLAQVRSQSQIALRLASSGIAALLLSGGRTVHSRLKVPIDINELSVSNIWKQSSLAQKNFWYGMKRACQISTWLSVLNAV